MSAAAVNGAPVDVLIVGSGAAGLLAAAEAARQGASVVVLSKGQTGRSGATATITGDISVDGATIRRLGHKVSGDDSMECFYEDTMAGGARLNRPELVQSMVEEVGGEVKALMEAGLKVVGIGHAPGHRHPRGVLVSGMHMLQILSRQARTAGVRFRDEFYVTDVLVDQGVAAGVCGIDLRNGELVGIQARSVVIATGGGAMSYPVRTAPEELVGDGYRMALEAGAELVDMEMVQFLPCCLVDPPLWRGIQFPWILGPQSGTRAWLLNRHGERFMARYDPERMEMSTRDILSLASVREALEGRGGPNGGVFMSWAHLPRDILEFLPSWYGKPLLHSGWRWEGFDFAPLVERIQQGYAVEVAPAAHFHMGGIRIDVDGQTAVPGLLACGEVAGGLHGGNRLSGNACSQFLVQGRRAGAAAARHAAAHAATASAGAWQAAQDRLLQRIGAGGSEPHVTVEKVRELANTGLNVVREGEGIREALDGIRALARECASAPPAPRTPLGPFPRQAIDALEVSSILCTAEAIAASALSREDSRGAHYRTDFPAARPEHARNRTVRLTEGALEVATT